MRSGRIAAGVSFLVLLGFALCGVLIPMGDAAAGAGQAAYFVLAEKADIKNPNAPSLRIDAGAGQALWDHTGPYGGPGTGGDWKVLFTFSVPRTLIPGEKAVVKVGITVTEVNPEQRMFIQMVVRAPDFAQAFSVQYPTKASDSKTFEIPISASYRDAEKFTITIEVVSATVTYVYLPAGATKTVTEPAPGKSVTAVSPNNLPVDCTGSPDRSDSSGASTKKCAVTTTVANSAGDLKGTTLVGAGERTRAQAAGEAVAACWLIGPDALTITDSALRARLQEPLMKKIFAKATPQAQLLICMHLVQLISQRKPARADTSDRTTRSSAGGCRAQRVTIAGRTRNGKVVLRPAKRALTATSIRYSCSASRGKATITVDGRVKGGLRKALGKKLRLGVVRAKNAQSRGAKLTFMFGF